MPLPVECASAQTHALAAPPFAALRKLVLADLHHGLTTVSTHQTAMHIPASLTEPAAAAHVESTKLPSV